MPRTEWGWLITAEELRAWTIEESEELLAVNKPAGVVCHPSKHGAWSSLVGAAREYLGAPVLHVPSRLDRETSGVVVLARDKGLGRKMQKSIQAGRVRKSYAAILEGRLEERRVVDLPVGRAEGSRVFLKQGVRPDGRAARTVFEPVEWAGGKTLVRVRPETGRLHQIRVHASAIGHAVTGDKLYGPDESLFLEFIAHGFTDRLKAALEMERQALHAEELAFELAGGPRCFPAPLAEDMARFWQSLKEADRRAKGA